jgi:thiamine-phosphate pyrophosphorylase
MSARYPVALAISDGAGRAPDELRSWAGGLAAAGVDAVQLREKDLSDVERFRRARAIAEVLADGPTRLLINARFDIAMISDAAGVHLPSHGVPVKDVRGALGSTALIGRSTHSVGEVDRALEEGADYVTFGPIYDTPSKREYGPPLGLEALREAAGVGVPVLAIGGVTTDRLTELASTGAAGIAAIRLFQASRAQLQTTMTRVREAFTRS